MPENSNNNNQQDFIPAAPQLWLYDFLVRILTREKTWRRALLKEMNTQPNDRIADIGCGTGTLISLIVKDIRPQVLVGIDPDLRILEMARRKTDFLNDLVEFRQGFARDAFTLLGGMGINKIVSSLVFHQVPLNEKLAGLESMYRALSPGGQLFIADYGLQRTSMMKKLFCIVQYGDGFENTQPNAEGVLPDLILKAGFIEVRETQVIQTPTGSISIYKARRN